MGCAHRGTKTFTAPAAYRYSRPFCAAYIGYCISLVQAAQKPRPPPGRNHKVKIAQQFLQIIHAALFCAALPRSIITHRKAGTKKPGPGSMSNQPSKKNTTTTPKGIIHNPARRPAGQGQARGANPHAPPCLYFFCQAKKQRRKRRPCFYHFPQTATPAFLAPQSPVHKSPFPITAQKTPAPRPRQSVTFFP
jgi:hypothetical protein